MRLSSSFRLAVITDEISQDIGTAIELCREYGIGAVELRSVDNEPLYRLSGERIEDIGARLQEAGIAVCGLCAPLFKCELDDAEHIREHRAMLQRYLDIAVRWGVPYVRGFSFWARGPFAAAQPRIAAELRAVVPLLKAAGVTLALEFDPATYATNGAKTRSLVDAVGSPLVKALYDPGNDLWDPDGEIPYPDGYRKLQGAICHIHLKDAVRTADGVEGVAIGRGEVDYRGLFKQLVQDGYDGYLVVETHYRLASRLTEEQLKRPQGRSFSAGGEEATRECLDSLCALLQELGIAPAGLKPRPNYSGRADRMPVFRYDTRRQMGQAAGTEAAACIRALLSRQSNVRVIFAAAPSQNEFLESLAQAEGIDWSRVTAFHMDEYIGLPPDAPQSFSRFLRERLFDIVRPGTVHLLDPNGVPQRECERYAKLIGEAPIDIVCLGIGENGHIAFNDPPVADFADPAQVKVVALDLACRRQQVNDGCFAQLQDVPTCALTLTIPALVSARRLFCIVPGRAKRAAVLHTLLGPIATDCPATVLRKHAGCTLYVDNDSCGLPDNAAEGVGG